MYYVCKKNSKYYVPTATWTWAYENGAIASPVPVASYETWEQAIAAANTMNKGAAPPKFSQSPSERPTGAPGKRPYNSAPSPGESSRADTEGRQRRNLREVTDYVDPSTFYEGPSYSDRILQKHSRGKTRYQPVYKSRDEVFQDAIQELCDRYLMHVKFKGGIAFITTISGEWQFRYNDRPILLFHTNAFKSKGKGDLHNQNMRFYSPVDVIRYIRFHERERTERLMSECEENDGQ